MTDLVKMLRDEEGATMVEYGVIVALIAAVCIAVVALIGTNINAAFTSVNSKL
jgi:pilus assembly protein Flp/PilA